MFIHAVWSWANDAEEHLRALDLAYNVTEPNVQSFGNSHQGIQRNVYATAFNFSHVLVAQVGLLRQTFLAQSRQLAIAADVLTNYSTIRKCHNVSTKQEDTWRETRYMCYFVLALSCGAWLNVRQKMKVRDSKRNETPSHVNVGGACFALQLSPMRDHKNLYYVVQQRIRMLFERFCAIIRIANWITTYCTPNCNYSGFRGLPEGLRG
jgi:hypothetical protein